MPQNARTMRSFEKGGRRKEQPSCARLDGQECPSPHEKVKAACAAASIHKKSKTLRCNPRRWLWHGTRRSRGCRLVQNPMVDGEQRQLQPVRHADLVIHVAQIILDDLLGGSQLRGDFLVLVTLHD